MVNRDSYQRKQKKEAIQRLSNELADTDKQPIADTPVSKKRTQRNRADSTSTEEEAVLQSSVSKTWQAHLMVAFPVIVVICAVLAVFFISETEAQDEATSYQYIGTLPSEGQGRNETISLPPTGRNCTRRDNLLDPDVQAKSYVALFSDTYQIAFEKDPELQLPFASIAKLLGALVVLDNYHLTDEIGLLEQIDAEGNGMDLEVGELVSVQDLLGAALVGSRNDAMYALAQNYPGGTPAFVAQMQIKADHLGMRETTVDNVIGLDSPGQLSTVKDIGILMISVMKEPALRSILAQPSYTVRTSYGRVEVISTTNALLGTVEGVVAGKTGYTQNAGLSLVTYVDDDPDIVTVVFNAEDRYTESEKLIEAVKEGYVCR